MVIWTSGELQHTIYADCRSILNEIETKINNATSDTQYSFNKWAFIPIIKEIDSPIYKEVVRKDKKNKVLEFRLKVDYSAFLGATFDMKRQLLISSLFKSIELMPGLGVPENEVTQLRATVHKVLDVTKPS